MFYQIFTQHQYAQPQWFKLLLIVHLTIFWGCHEEEFAPQLVQVMQDEGGAEAIDELSALIEVTRDFT